MRAAAFVWVVWLSICAYGSPQAAQEADVRQVRVTAQGYNRDDALKQALRKALEKGAGAQISAHTEVENFTLIRDTIYSRAAGVVSDYRIIDDHEAAGGIWEITIEASVRPDAVAAAWGEVQNLLDQLGRPKIMVWVDERIDGRLQDDSVVASRLEQMFLKAGFDLVEHRAVDELRRRERRDAESAGDEGKLARLAKDTGAHILIRGSAQADQAGLRRVYGTHVAFYSCSVQAKIYYTDTGRLLVSESIPTRERGLRSYNSFNPQAARATLVAATFPDSAARLEPTLAGKLYEAVMQQWSTQLTAGGDIELEVDRLNFKTFVQIKNQLAELERVQSVNADFTKNTGLFRIKAQINAATLAELLIEKPFSTWLSITDLKPNRIQARGLAPSESTP